MSLKGIDYKVQTLLVYKKMHIENLIFDVKALLGAAELTQEEYHSLIVGDIIMLDKHVEEKIDVSIGNEVHFSALPGNYEIHKAIKIL